MDLDVDEMKVLGAVVGGGKTIKNIKPVSYTHLTLPTILLV